MRGAAIGSSGCSDVRWMQRRMRRASARYLQGGWEGQGAERCAGCSDACAVRPPGTCGFGADGGGRKEQPTAIKDCVERAFCNTLFFSHLCSWLVCRCSSKLSRACPAAQPWSHLTKLRSRSPRAGSRGGQIRAGQSRSEQVRGQGRADQSRSEQVRGQRRAGERRPQGVVSITVHDQRSGGCPTGRPRRRALYPTLPHYHHTWGKVCHI